VRARWIIEDLARGQWQLVVTELPPGTSTQKVLEEIEELTNPKVKAGKKALTQEQVQLKPACWRCWTRCATRAARTRRCAWCSSPRAAPWSRQELITTLLAHTSLESSVPDQPDHGGPGRPAGAEEPAPDAAPSGSASARPRWQRRTRHRLDKVLDRIHVLEGRQLVLLNIDEVIRIIRNSRRAQAGADRALALSDRQAEDILEIRLRQLARLEAIKIEQELKELRTEQGKLEDILASPAGAQAHGDQGDRGRRQGSATSAAR
jgi:topoisomerase-4 subunit A